MIAYVYNGGYSFLDLKGIFEIPNVPIERSIGEITNTQIILNGPEAYLLNNLDLIRIYTNFGEIWGFILDVEHKKGYAETCIASLAIGTDGFIMEESGVMVNAEYESYNNFAEMLGEIIGNEDLILGKPYYFLSTPLTEDNDMPSFPTIQYDSVFTVNTLCIDAMAQAAKFRTRVVDDLLEFAYFQDYIVRGISYRINLDDTVDYTINLAKDSFTIVKVAGDDNNGIIWFAYAAIMKDGTIVNDPDIFETLKPEITKVITTKKERDETQPNFIKRLNREAKQELVNYAYNNSIEMVVDIDNYIYKGILFSDKVDPFYYLGNSGELTLPDGTKLLTTISAISLQDNIAKITFGMSQKRTFQKIKRRKRV